MPNLTKRGFKKPLETEAYDININNFNTDKTEEELDKLLLKDGDGKDVKVTFVEAEIDSELTSQSKLSNLFGLVKRKFNVVSQTLEQKADLDENGKVLTSQLPTISGLELGETSSTAYRGDRGKIAYDHSQSTHAPNNAQKNSDITKAEIEAKLTGAITTHTHTTVNGKTVTQTPNTTEKTDIIGMINEVNNKPTVKQDAIYTSSATFTVPKTGEYIVICIGKGGDGTRGSYGSGYTGGCGSGGGTAISRISLTQGATIPITINNTLSSFGSYTTASAGATPTSAGSGSYNNAIGGTASGGNILNASGQDGAQYNRAGGNSGNNCGGGGGGLSSSTSAGSATSNPGKDGYIPYLDKYSGGGGAGNWSQGAAGGSGGIASPGRNGANGGGIYPGKGGEGSSSADNNYYNSYSAGGGGGVGAGGAGGSYNGSGGAGGTGMVALVWY